MPSAIFTRIIAVEKSPCLSFAVAVKYAYAQPKAIEKVSNGINIHNTNHFKLNELYFFKLPPYANIIIIIYLS